MTGSQFAASLVSRFWSGHYADSRGAKRAVVAGLLAAAASGLLYLLSLAFVGTPATSVAVLLLGRGLLGAAESFIITGAVSWGLALVDPRDTGKVIAWVGTAMFAAMALGAPAGTALYARYGFAAIALATTLAPLATLVSVLPLRPVAPLHRGRPALLRVLGTVWVPGLGAAFGSVGFGAIIAFGSLLFAERGWSPVWLVFSAFAAALIVARVLCGHLPDRLGGAKVALTCALVEA
ncbi:MAG TPA: MFS transporter, partial [Gaiellales bacterium]|nr:MFS transporter [Gaiellales bacterium]